VSKDFSLGEQRLLEFSWQAFNATNSVRYDVRGAQPSLSYDPTQFGKYLNTLTTPRFMQFALRFEFWACGMLAYPEEEPRLGWNFIALIREICSHSQSLSKPER
jgi:hypothetical protein